MLLSVVAGNRATSPAVSGGGGGGIFSDGGAVNLTDSTVRGNVATATGTGGQNGGGGIRVDGASLRLETSTVSGNTANVAGNQSGGGGVWTSSTDVETSTISGNTLNTGAVATQTGGGGLFTLDFGATVLNSTIAANSSTAPGGGLFNAALSATVLGNTIVAANAGENCAGTTDSSNNNIQSDSSCSFGQGSDQSNTDPLIDPLGDYGGPTQTHRLRPGSPAINGAAFGQCFPSDQRGIVRGSPPGGDCDIGAFEFDGLATAASPTAPLRARSR